MNFLATLIEWLKDWWPFCRVMIQENAVRYTYCPWEVRFWHNGRFCWKVLEPHVLITNLKPGLHRRLPWIEEVDQHSKVQDITSLEPQYLITADGLPMLIHCKILYRVANYRKATLRVHDYESSIKGLAEIFIAKHVRDYEWEYLRKNASTIEGELVSYLKPHAHKWGTQIIEVGFTSLSPSNPHFVHFDEMPTLYLSYENESEDDQVPEKDPPVC